MFLIKKLIFTPFSKKNLSMIKKIIFYFLCASLLINTVQVSMAVEEDKYDIERDLYAGMNYKKIFDQSNVLTKYSNIIDQNENFNKALVKDYLTKKEQAKKRAIYAPLFFTGIPLLIASSSLYLAKNPNATMLLQFSLIAYGSKMIEQLFKVGYCFFKPPSDPLAQYEKCYAERKRFLSPTLQNRLEDVFSAARKNPTNIDTALLFANIALNLPLKSKQLSMPNKEELNTLLHGYEPILDEKLIIKLFHHHKRFSTSEGPLKTPKSVLYFQGPPGTGKTYVAHELATLMNAPIIELKACEDSTSITGSDTSPGSLLEAISKPNMTRNAIIFIDEADRIINKEGSSLQSFLPLLEPSTTYFYSPYLRTNIDISHFCFILAGNTEIKDHALKSRLAVIEFKGTSKAFKESMVYEMIKQTPSMQSLRNLDEAMNQSITTLINQEPNIRQLQLAVSDLINQHGLNMAYK